MTTACTHHWRIAPPEGPTSHGICTRCGAEKTFRNYSDESVWDDKAAPGRGERPHGFGRYVRDRVGLRAQLNEIPRSAWR